MFVRAKNAIVTGAGRNKGIGAEICRMLAKNGINVYFTSFDTYDTCVGGISNYDYCKTLEECRALGVKVDFVSSDLTNSDSVKKLFEDANEKFGDIDILVNCVCYHVFDDLKSLSEDLLDLNFNVNSKSILLLCKEFYLRYCGNEGRIINLSSTQNLESLTTEISYAISKSTIPVITTTLAPIMATKGITINSVNPGATDVGDVNDQNIHLYRKNNLFGRLGTPRDAANLIQFLISNEAKWITGQNLNSEGALFRGIK